MKTRIIKKTANSLNRQERRKIKTKENTNMVCTPLLKWDFKKLLAEENLPIEVQAYDQYKKSFTKLCMALEYTVNNLTLIDVTYKSNLGTIRTNHSPHSYDIEKSKTAEKVCSSLLYEIKKYDSITNSNHVFTSFWILSTVFDTNFGYITDEDKLNIILYLIKQNIKILEKYGTKALGSTHLVEKKVLAYFHEEKHSRDFDGAYDIIGEKEFKENFINATTTIQEHCLNNITHYSNENINLLIKAFERLQINDSTLQMIKRLFKKNLQTQNPNKELVTKRELHSPKTSKVNKDKTILTKVEYKNIVDDLSNYVDLWNLTPKRIISEEIKSYVVEGLLLIGKPKESINTFLCLVNNQKLNSILDMSKKSLKKYYRKNLDKYHDYYQEKGLLELEGSLHLIEESFMLEKITKDKEELNYLEQEIRKSIYDLEQKISNYECRFDSLSIDHQFIKRFNQKQVKRKINLTEMKPKNTLSSSERIEIANYLLVSKSRNETERFLSNTDGFKNLEQYSFSKLVTFYQENYSKYLYYKNIYGLGQLLDTINSYIAINENNTNDTNKRNRLYQMICTLHSYLPKNYQYEIQQLDMSENKILILK